MNIEPNEKHIILTCKISQSDFATDFAQIQSQYKFDMFWEGLRISTRSELMFKNYPANVQRTEDFSFLWVITILFLHQTVFSRWPAGYYFSAINAHAIYLRKKNHFIFTIWWELHAPGYWKYIDIEYTNAIYWEKRSVQRILSFIFSSIVSILLTGFVNLKSK